MINVTCPCGNQLSALEEQAGRTVLCPMCQRNVIIPGQTGIQSSAAPSPVAAGAPPARPGFDEEDRYARRHAGEPLRTDGMAVTSLVLGLISFCVPVVLSIFAIILGIISLTNIGKGKSKGSGFAITGIIAGSLSIIISPVLIVFALLLPAVQKVREAAMRLESANNMKQIGVAMHDYHAVHNKFADHAIYSQNGRPLLSWRVAILPYIEQNGLYRQFKLDQPWDSPNNKPLISLMPKEYFHPLQTEEPHRGLTYYQMFVGKPGVRPRPIFVSDNRNTVTLPRIQDGTANTVMIAEASTPVVWTKPDDIPYDPSRPVPKLGVLPRGFNLGFADGSVRSFRPGQLNQSTLRSAITMDGGEALFLP